jgi:hypothetical protein
MLCCLLDLTLLFLFFMLDHLHINVVSCCQCIICTVYFHQTVDERFNAEEQRFKLLESAVRTVLQDITSYIDQLEVHF